MSEETHNPAPGTDRYVVEYTSDHLGPEADVQCPRCERVIGALRQGEKGELLCLDCGMLYSARFDQGPMAVRELRRVVLIEDDGRPSAEQSLTRPDLEYKPLLRERIFMLLWSFFITGLMILGLWAAITYAAR